MEDPVVPLERNLYGHPLAGLFWERQFEKIQLKHGWEKIPNWECLFVHREKGLFLSVYVDDIKFAGKRQNIDPMWKVLNQEVDLGEPTSFLDHVYLGCTQRQCQKSKDIVDNYRTMFESRISAGGTTGACSPWVEDMNWIISASQVFLRTISSESVVRHLGNAEPVIVVNFLGSESDLQAACESRFLGFNPRVAWIADQNLTTGFGIDLIGRLLERW